MADTKPQKKHGDGGKWWVVHQHQEMRVVHSSDRPDSKVEPGERLKHIHGPFGNEADAKSRADAMKAKTARARVGREA